MAFDPSRLYAQLLNTGLQNSNNPHYQLLNTMIGLLTALSSATPTAGTSGGSSTVIVNNTIQQILGAMDLSGLEASNEGLMIPGKDGISGKDGLPGIPGFDGIDSDFDSIRPPGFLPYLLTLRTITVADANNFTPDVTVTDIMNQLNTQAIGNLTANAPTGSPTDGQILIIRLKSTNVQTFIWNAIYRAGVTVALPTVSSGGGLTDYLFFRYNNTDTKWDIQEANFGF